MVRTSVKGSDYDLERYMSQVFLSPAEMKIRILTQVQKAWTAASFNRIVEMFFVCVHF